MRGPGGFKARWWEEKSMPRRVGIYIDTPQGVCITREGWPVQRPLPGVPPRRSNRWPWLAIRRRFLEIRRRRLWSGRSRRLVRSIICTVRLLEPWTRPGFCSQTDRKFIKKNGLGYHTFPRNLVTNVNSTDCFGKWRFLRTETPGFWCLRSPALVKHGLCLPPWLWFVWVSILEVQQNRKRGKVCCLTWNKSKKMYKKNYADSNFNWTIKNNFQNVDWKKFLSLVIVHSYA